MIPEILSTPPPEKRSQDGTTAQNPSKEREILSQRTYKNQVDPKKFNLQFIKRINATILESSGQPETESHHALKEVTSVLRLSRKTLKLNLDYSLEHPIYFDDLFHLRKSLKNLQNLQAVRLVFLDCSEVPNIGFRHLGQGLKTLSSLQSCVTLHLCFLQPL